MRSFSGMAEPIVAPKEFLDGNVLHHENRPARKFHGAISCRLVYRGSRLRFLKNGRHVGGDRISPGIAVSSQRHNRQVPKVGDERRLGSIGRKTFQGSDSRLPRNRNSHLPGADRAERGRATRMRTDADKEHGVCQLVSFIFFTISRRIFFDESGKSAANVSAPSYPNPIL